jgi:uncharacterized protein YegP (UPF0339 family)
MKCEIYQKTGWWVWRCRADNGQVVLWSREFSTKKTARRGCINFLLRMGQLFGAEKGPDWKREIIRRADKYMIVYV